MNFKHGKLLDPKADVVFKKIFGQNKDLVKSFLNSLLPLPEDGLIESLEYLPSEQIPLTPLKKYSIVDVRCIDQKGRQFIVEMQMGWSPSFKKRLQFGVSKAYVSKLDVGENYNLLQPVYGLALIGEIFDKTSDEWYHHYQMVNVQDTEDQIKGLELIFVELPKFKPTTQWQKHLGILWIRFLNEIATLQDIPEEMQDNPEISKAIQLTQEASYSPSELAEYDGYWDIISIEKTIKIDAEQMGMQKGKMEGLIEGEQKAKREIALNLLKLMIPDATIIQASGLTQTELDTLKFEISE